MAVKLSIVAFWFVTPYLVGRMTSMYKTTGCYSPQDHTLQLSIVSILTIGKVCFSQPFFFSWCSVLVGFGVTYISC